MQVRMVFRRLIGNLARVKGDRLLLLGLRRIVDHGQFVPGASTNLRSLVSQAKDALADIGEAAC